MGKEDEKLDPDDYPEIVEEWLNTFYGRKRNVTAPTDKVIATDCPD